MNEILFPSLLLFLLLLDLFFSIQQKILSGALDETNKRGSRTRLLRFDAGTYTTKPFVHEYWEEVFLVSGDLTVGNDEQGKGGESFSPFTATGTPLSNSISTY